MPSFFYRIAAGLAVLPAFLLPVAAHAQVGKALDNLKAAQPVGSSDVELPGLVGNLINAVLGVMGILFVILIVYAGILYLQGGMDKEKINKAKSLIINAVIGLVIVVAAYAISSFIITQVIGVASPAAATPPAGSG